MCGEFLHPNLPIVLVDLKEDKSCKSFENGRGYIEETLSTCFSKDRIPEDASAWLDLSNLCYEDYLEKIKSRYKSKSALRDVQNAYSQGYVCKPFSKLLFMPDIVSIHHSKEIRSGGPISGFFLQTLEEMGGAPKEYIPFQFPSCPDHYALYWGIFAQEPGHKQGSVLTNERLLGYAFIRRVGNLSLYSQLIGHGEYLKHGIIYALHFAVVEWLCKRDNPYTQGIKHLMHGRYWDGGEGRILWRKKTGFEPANFVLCDKTTNN
jgi:hypothetical protein